jgi:hypothetical protein
MKFLTAEERAAIKVNVFRLASQLVAQDDVLRAAAEAPDHQDDFTVPAAPDPYGVLRAAKKPALPADGSAPRSYDAALAALRAAEAPPAPGPTFEDSYKAARLKALAEEYARYEESKR